MEVYQSNTIARRGYLHSDNILVIEKERNLGQCFKEMLIWSLEMISLPHDTHYTLIKF